MNLIPRPPVEAVHVAHDADVAPGAFTIGSTLRHVLVMTATGAAGLVAVFMVEFLTLLYISRLGDTDLTAAVGYASQVTFLLISTNIGLTIALGALVSRALGARDREKARRIAASGVTLMALIAGTLSFALMPFTHAILAAIGARGATLEVASLYLRIVLPGTLLLGLGMAFSAVLRGVGDARRAMFVTLGGAIVTACLDPIFIFVLHLGIVGAGIVVLISRLALAATGWHGAVRVHGLVGRPSLAGLRLDAVPLAVIAAPAVLTNIASPIANIYAMRIFSRFGDTTVAAFAIMDRVTPVAFGVLFALSGAVGPIMGQNFGAKLFGRVRACSTIATALPPPTSCSSARRCGSRRRSSSWSSPPRARRPSCSPSSAASAGCCGSSSVACLSQTPPTTTSAGRSCRRRSTGAAPRSGRSRS